MKLRNVYLTVFILSAIFVALSAFDTAPDAKIINLFGYNVGMNFTHNIWVKVLGILAFSMYIFNPTFKTAKTENK
jgi:hypothetical protein